MSPHPSNYFAFKTAAQRYGFGRPFFHPIVRDAIQARRSGLPRVKRALDIACGTGLSARILAEIADQVSATDVSAEMIAEAGPYSNVEYIASPAERLPFEAETFELATVALAFHWLDREPFLREAHRVLKPGGLLVIYNHWFCGEMDCKPDFRRWHLEEYLARYPSPKRDSRPLDHFEAMAAGLRLEGTEPFSNHWPFSVDWLAHYLVSQSNVIAAVELGRESIDDAIEWIVDRAKTFFQSEQEVFRFQGSITYLSRNAESATPPT